MTFVTFLKCFPRTHLSSLFLSVLQNKVIYLNTLSMCPPLWCTTHSRRRWRWQKRHKWRHWRNNLHGK